jgi:L-ascorbate metabolism protein UlaG (beta-lactamase superfamily)
MAPIPFENHLRFARSYVRRTLEDRRRNPTPEILPSPHRPNPASWPEDRLTLSWLGHATVLINFHGTMVLTDPALELRIGIGRGFAKVGPRRLVEPALRPRELPDIDLVLLSHAHMDHTDLGTLGRLNANTPVIVQSGNADLVRRFSNVRELSWGETAAVDTLRIQATEARHWGARMITDSHRGYGGYLLRKDGRSILFAGDTAYTDVLTRYGRNERIDLAILPIGAYDPWIANHASPEQAWKMFKALGAEYVLPVHHSTFRLSREPAGEPIQRLLAAAGTEKWRVLGTDIGTTTVVPATSQRNL